MNKQNPGIEWRPVVGFEGLYEVSNDGQVRSLDGAFAHKKGRVLKQKVTRKGYLSVSLAAESGRSKSVHRLVAIAFLGTPPLGSQVNHRNGIKTDNRIENLEYVTSSQNNLHALRTGLRTTASGEDNGQAKLTRETVWQIKMAVCMCGRELPRKVIADRAGVSLGTICDIISGRTWKDVKI